MPIYQITYDNINTDRVKEALYKIVKREIKEDEHLTPSDPICRVQSSVWFIYAQEETIGSHLIYLDFPNEDIIVTKIASVKAIKTNNPELRAWMEAHAKQDAYPYLHAKDCTS